jgi:hypothetical protein
MNEPDLIISDDMTRYDDIIGYVNQLHPERGCMECYPEQ